MTKTETKLRGYYKIMKEVRPDLCEGVNENTMSILIQNSANAIDKVNETNKSTTRRK